MPCFKAAASGINHFCVTMNLQLTKKQATGGRLLLCFDADDTLWDNQTYYDEVEEKWMEVMQPYGSREYLHDELFKVETKNMPTMGYGTKAYCLSLVETALKLSGHTITATDLQRIYDAGTQLLHMPATPFEGVAETLDQLSQHYTLICLTKGDLLDQQNKLRRSGLKPYFNHIEIVAEKTVGIYANLCHRYSTTPSHFVMTGNSFKSDIDPVLQIGGYGIHIPFKRMWAYEKTEEYTHDKLFKINSFQEIPQIIDRIREKA